MSNTILLKRDDTPGKVPLITDLAFGELGYNSYDGKLYAKRAQSVGSPIGGSPLVEEIIIIGDPSGKVVDQTGGHILPQTGTTTIPLDDTVPLITEGTEIGAGIVYPESVTNIVDIHFSMSIESSTANKIIVLAIFRDTTCIGAIPITIASNNSPSPLSWELFDIPETVGTVTYSGRIGINGGAWRVNQSSLGTLGGAIADASTFSLQVTTA